ncbi:MAG TPA: hypothetical protein PK331_09275 [Gordonia sp. (in: high G+C Gram-positive bacteria)]|uniref:hypothetical protein n=1 Tax=unclassified Gordonia (in: high G+C Gram-positive bacteria) TaxID=2657482 RepID=UPI0025B8EF7C|nr:MULTISPECIES: hypothetical protein [unclassified Gordonia (in: high G+C Gram-positive bacteria)]HNP57519.1 hypothetical protein [Gordonia sp. (in: high G+C Gram-positive bacteria)]HRC51096.1 hypothetical protein [Gordonia sp. (in: high G+C Gram-positive bacteria)]
MRGRDQFEHQDLGLGYPPADETEDLRAPAQGNAPGAHPTKNDTEGDHTTNHQKEQ